nr:L,D-transpeptidase family protein [Agaricicola taiwanensis]
MPCAVGRSGVGTGKREGDGVTPLAILPLRRIWWRADRGQRPLTTLPLRHIRSTDGWCDAVGDRNYNRHVQRPYPTSHEAMWRDDRLYDLVVELGWNDHPRRQARGSAIFMHVARCGFKPTEGCVALTHRDLRWLLARLGPKSRMAVEA